MLQKTRKNTAKMTGLSEERPKCRRRRSMYKASIRERWKKILK